MDHFEHLGPYSDLVAFAQAHQAAMEDHRVGDVGPEAVRSRLGLADDGEAAPLATTVERWRRDGLDGEEITWSVGYGPPTHAYVLRPAGSSEPLPGVVALHGHDGVKYHGKEKIADGPTAPPPAVVGLRATHYEGRAFANELAREGFVVLVHDVFSWGSRRFPYDQLPPLIRRLAEATRGLAPPDETPAGTPDEVALYDAAAWHHEHLIEKYCAVLGTTFAGIVASEDRVAAAYLASRPDVIGGGIGCIGLSGGGCRSALLHATCDEIRAAVIVAMMSTYRGLLDHNVIDHTWMLLPPGWARTNDWPDLAASRAPTPLLVQYDRDDALFTQEGMADAHDRITDLYRRSGHPDGYEGRFYDGPHRFDAAMQEDAFSWLRRQLRPEGAADAV